jgi:5-methylcytosine-specific restriction protein A
MYPFEIGKKYARRDVYKVIGIPQDTRGGNWDTGYNQYKSDFFLFCNVGVPGRTGHDYRNRFEGPDLYWYAKSHTTISQPQIRKLLDPSGAVYIFYRTSDNEPFTFAGFGVPKSYQAETPVQITWEIQTEVTDGPSSGQESALLREGAYKSIKVNAFERNPVARDECLKHNGVVCMICGFDFEKHYGELGAGFIHVHHIVPISDIGSAYEVDPAKDLIPVCPNCHAMLHRKRPTYSVNEIRQAYKNQ